MAADWTSDIFAVVIIWRTTEDTTAHMATRLAHGIPIAGLDSRRNLDLIAEHVGYK
jgi:hypothetical protein